MLREYRPDYGLDFAVEIFKSGDKAEGRSATYETLGEHIFVQLKSIGSPEIKSLTLYERDNVEKGREVLNKERAVARIDTYRFALETRELVTVERMGIGVPVLLVLADLNARRCSFVCLNDYIDKILVPRHGQYRSKGTRTIHVPVRNEIGTEHGEVALRWYGKRPKLLAAFQRFSYQYTELGYAQNRDWRGLAERFARRIADYDFWTDTEMWKPIGWNATALTRFIKTGQPGLVKPVGDIGADLAAAGYFDEQDVFELWRQLSLLPRMYEDVCREWYLPTSLGHMTSAPP